MLIDVRTKIYKVGIPEILAVIQFENSRLFQKTTFLRFLDKLDMTTNFDNMFWYFWNARNIFPSIVIRGHLN